MYKAGTQARRLGKAQRLRRAMDAAIENVDREAFVDAFTDTMGYIKKAERREYFKRFMDVYKGSRR